eukprot:7776310-Karenia_brevis.AAC.1
MCTYSTPAKLAGHDGDGLAPIGHARPDLSDVEFIEKLEEEVDFVPTHTNSNNADTNGTPEQ